METLRFLMANWVPLTMAPVLVMVWQWIFLRWMNPPFKITHHTSVKEKVAYTTRILDNLVAIAPIYMTEAECKFALGSNILKRAYVIEKLYWHIPDEYKKYVCGDNFDSIITTVMPGLRVAWEDEPLMKDIKGGVPNARC